MAFTDSTIFSNFCLFQPGKINLLLDMVEWLNHGGPWIDPAPWLGLLGLIVLVAGGWIVRAGQRPGSCCWPASCADGRSGNWRPAPCSASRSRCPRSCGLSCASSSTGLLPASPWPKGPSTKTRRGLVSGCLSNGFRGWAVTRSAPTTPRRWPATPWWSSVPAVRPIPRFATGWPDAWTAAAGSW